MNDYVMRELARQRHDDFRTEIEHDERAAGTRRLPAEAWRDVRIVAHRVGRHLPHLRPQRLTLHGHHR
jgi:hypothetical protein